MNFAVGSLVKVRGREWVVLPDSTAQLLQLRPIGAPELETTAILPSLEMVEPAQFGLPDPSNLGDLRSARLLREAVRLGFRSAVGPFRSLASIAVEPRPYQLVPLLMALRQNPVRLLIADDVGIGKTVEAALVAKEMLARGEVTRLCVLCPPHLAEQWQSELETKFGLEAALVLPSTVSKLERQCAPGESVFERFANTIVSLDYIKSERRRDDFLRTCPDLVIVDEAHTCTQTGAGAQQQRFRLLQQLSARQDRHIILVTATPHSGNEGAFRSLLSLLKDEFGSFPDDVAPESRRKEREALARHFVQRRRGDIAKYLDEDTPFPQRLEADRTYKLHPDYRQFLDRALKYAREVIQDDSGTKFQQRIRWWSALALLRSISSSPDAAIATLRARAQSADSESVIEAEELGRRSVLDLADVETADATDTAPGADFEEDESPTRRRLLELARIAETLRGDKDRKLTGLLELVKELLAEGCSPIVFCRYIPTAEYIAEEFRKRLKGVEVGCVTGQLPHDEREARVEELGQAEKRVLVCTDCLSEGINLQEWFDAAVHADLAWSPTRHEQREGRVDRFNQRSPKVRVVTFFGEDNPIDGIVLNILLRKHQTIRSSLGISVPVPSNSEKVLEAIFEALLLKGDQSYDQLTLFEDFQTDERKALDAEWQRAAEREKASRTIFAQHAIKPDEVKPELEEIRKALGAPLDMEQFVRDAIRAHDGLFSGKDPTTLDLTPTPLALRDALRFEKPVKVTFRSPAPKGSVVLNRTHPLVESLASYVMDSALSNDPASVAKRCGVVGTDAVSLITTLMILRFRFQIVGAKGEMLAEDVVMTGFEGNPMEPKWITEAQAEALLAAPAKANIGQDQSQQILEKVLQHFDGLRKPLREMAQMRAEAVLRSHRRVRKALDASHAAREIKVQGDPDVLGVYVLFPVGGGR